MTTPASSELINQLEPVLVRPQWSLPPGIYAAVTTRGCRRNGNAVAIHSAKGMDHFNLATHVGDELTSVQARRALLQQALALPAPVPWLNQVHGVQIFCLGRTATSLGTPPTADACVSVGEGAAVCAVLTADCLPILLCSQSGAAIAAVHAGWRGLLAGVIEATLAAMPSHEAFTAYIGPAIGAAAFEVGAEVVDAFASSDPSNREYFVPSAGGKSFGDLAGLARARLLRAGVHEVVLSGRCTVQESSIFYSHRAGQGSVGRFASLIWRNPAST